jgi:predicted SAM-dependent methyltransferase
LRLNLGCGPNREPGWVNIDAFDKGADLHLDLREDLPFADGSVDVIYSEHFFEHLDYPRDVVHLLSEARRVLMPGGLFSVGVPRIENALGDYASGRTDWFDKTRGISHPDWCNTRAHQINYLFRQAGEHLYAYDFETLSVVLREAGFIDLVERDWTAGLDAETRKGSLYIDAINPTRDPARAGSRAIAQMATG